MSRKTDTLLLRTVDNRKEYEDDEKATRNDYQPV